MRPISGMEGAIALRRWRRNAGLSRPAAAGELGISERMLAYYEAGERPVPRAILLAQRAISSGLGRVIEDTPSTRERWVELVRSVLSYGAGEPVVGRLIRGGEAEQLAGFLTFIRQGPDPSLALTDPALFRSLRAAITRAQLGGLGTFQVASGRRTEAPLGGGLDPTDNSSHDSTA